MSFEFIKDRLDLPSLRIRARQLDSGHLARVKQRCEQSERSSLYTASVVNGVINDTNDHGIEFQVAVLAISEIRVL